MSPEVTAAIIAGSVGMVTLIATVIVQIVGFRSTKANTEQQIKATHKDTADTLGHQREQLDITLAEQRIRTLNERFATAAEQLGSEKPAVRLAGVYAMGGLADDWRENRQTCVDVLCAYLRMPYEPDPGQDAPEPQRLAFRGDREVRHTVIRVITAHLKKEKHDPKSWQGLDFDFTGVVFDGGDFSGAEFSGGTVIFSAARFSGDAVLFRRAEFSGGKVYFDRVQFSGRVLDFTGAEFSGGEIYFNAAEFSGYMVSFVGAQFSGSEIYFVGTQFSDGLSCFSEAHFSGGEVDFMLAEFSGGEVSFGGAQFSGGTVSFSQAQFRGSRVDFTRTRSDVTGEFIETQFSGGEIDFSDVGDWSFSPAFPWKDTPPSGVKLPRAKDQSKA